MQRWKKRKLGPERVVRLPTLYWLIFLTSLIRLAILLRPGQSDVEVIPKLEVMKVDETVVLQEPCVQFKKSIILFLKLSGDAH